MEKPQPVIWMVQFNDGKRIQEISPDGKEIVFDGDFLKQKNDFRYIGLIDVINDLAYSIDLENGCFILRNQNFHISRELDGRIHKVSGRDDVDYRSGVIQFKCTLPMDIKFTSSYHNAQLKLPQSKPEVATFNIGYKVGLSEDFCVYKKGNDIFSIVRCQALLSIDAKTLQPSISTTFGAKIKMENGNEVMVKL